MQRYDHFTIEFWMTNADLAAETEDKESNLGNIIDTIGDECLALARERVKEAGLPNKVTVDFET